MKKTVRLAAIVFVTVVVFRGTDAVAGGDPASAGAATFAAKCASCHGKDASGSTPMGKKMGLRDLGSADVQKQTDKQLSDIMAKGKNKMPAFGQKLTAPKINDLVMYIRTLAKK